MQSRKAAALRQAWERRGAPPCPHPRLEPEYDLGASTGDYCCDTCGATDRREVLEAARSNHSHDD